MDCQVKMDNCNNQNVEYLLDPFSLSAEGIWDYDVWYWYCENCYHDACMEV